MNKLNLLLTALFLAAAGCSDDATEDMTTVAPAGGTRTIKITAELSGEDGTRANWTDGKGLNWDSADQFGVFTNKGEHIPSSNLTIDPNTGAATFEAEISTEATKIWVYYPYKSVDNAANEGDCTAHFTIAANQTQAVAGKMERTNDKVAFIGKTPLDALSSSITAEMQSMASMIRFIIYSSSETLRSEKVQSVSFQSNVNSNGDRLCVGTFGNNELRGENIANGTQLTTLTLNTPYALTNADSKENAAGLYMGLFPITAPGYTYTVETDIATYTFTSEKEKVFKDNMIHNIFLDLKNAVRVEKGLTFSHGGRTFSIGRDGSTFEIGATDATYKGERIIFKEHLDNPPVFVCDADWLKPEWVNTDNFNMRIIVSKNKKAEPREAKIYIKWNGIQSSDYILVKQDPGTGEPTVIPTLNYAGSYNETSEIPAVGGTIENIATLSLNVDGVNVATSEIDTYMQYVILSCGTATVNRSGANISIVFPENTLANIRTYALKATTADGTANLTFKQEGNSEAPKDTYEYSLAIVNHKWGNSWGFGPGDANKQTGHYLTINELKINGEPANFTNSADDLALAQSIAEQAFVTVAPTDEEKSQCNHSAFTSTTCGIKAFYCNGSTIQIAWVLPGNKTIFKTVGYDGNGTEVGSVIVWVDE